MIFIQKNHMIEKPPSIKILWPEIKFDAGEHKNRTKFATSLGFPNLPLGIFASIGLLFWGSGEVCEQPCGWTSLQN